MVVVFVDNLSSDDDGVVCGACRQSHFNTNYHTAAAIPHDAEIWSLSNIDLRRLPCDGHSCREGRYLVRNSTNDYSNSRFSDCGF